MGFCSTRNVKTSQPRGKVGWLSLVSIPNPSSSIRNMMNILHPVPKWCCCCSKTQKNHPMQTKKTGVLERTWTGISRDAQNGQNPPNFHTTLFQMTFQQKTLLSLSRFRWEHTLQTCGKTENYKSFPEIVRHQVVACRQYANYTQLCQNKFHKNMIKKEGVKIQKGPKNVSFQPSNIRLIKWFAVRIQASLETSWSCAIPKIRF